MVRRRMRGWGVVHMAMECNAPVHELDWEDIAFDKAGIAQAYDALMELLSEFNDQMRVATGDCMSTPYSIAKKGHTVMRPNPWEGVAVWVLMGSLGGSSGTAQVLIDDLTAKLRALAIMDIKRAIDVESILSCANS